MSPSGFVANGGECMGLQLVSLTDLVAAMSQEKRPVKGQFGRGLLRRRAGEGEAVAGQAAAATT